MKTIRQWWQKRREAKVSTDTSFVVRHSNWLLTALITSTLIVSVVWGLFFGGRSLWHRWHHSKSIQRPVVTQPQPRPQPVSSDDQERPPAGAFAPRSSSTADSPPAIPRSGPEN